MSGKPTVVVSADEERAVIVQVLSAFGAPGGAAADQARWLVEADLRGYPSHGIQRLPILAARMSSGAISPATSPSLSWRGESVLVVDGQRGFGPVVALRALHLAMERLRATGIVLVAIRNANHLGILAPYVEMLTAAHLIGIAMTTSEALVHPWGGQLAMIGTNPLAIGVPAEPHPLILDMATGQVSMGQILNYLQRGAELEPGWAVNSDGVPTTDPLAASQGAITPFGGAKGYGLGLALEVLVASLTSSGLGRNVRGTLDVDQVCNKGDVFICINPAVIADDASAAVTSYLHAVRLTPRQPGSGGVRIPGQRAAAERARRIAEGIELTEATWHEALALLKEGGTSRPPVDLDRAGPHPDGATGSGQGRQDTVEQCFNERT
jgi:LDH2 family malate/lactate/ureidoglycolate dehydrogenase